MNAVNKLLKAYGHNTTLHYDKWSEKHAYRALNDGNLKQWISNILPSELLERNIKKAVESIVTLCECTTFYKKFPLRDSLAVPRQPREICYALRRRLARNNAPAHFVDPKKGSARRRPRINRE